MKTKFVKSLAASALGAGMTGISLYGMNPVGMAAYGAIQGSSLMAVPGIPLFLAAIYMQYGFLNTFKYAIVMFLTTAFIVTAKYMDKGTRQVNPYVAALATALSYGLMECTDVLMEQGNAKRYAVVALSTILVFSMTALFGKLIEIFLGEDRIKYGSKLKRRQEDRNKTEKIAGNYEEKIRLMAESFEKM